MLNANALRLSALVAAAVGAGYLWRSALDARVPEKVLVATPPAVRFPLPAAPFSSLASLHPLQAQHTEPVTRKKSRGRSLARSKRRAPAPAGRAEAIAFVSRPATAAPASPRRPGRTSHAKPKPKPKPPPNGRPPPPPPAPDPRPNPPPPPPSAGPPPAPAPAPPPPPPPSGGGTRPGNGKGDKNHVHTGPPGQQKEKGKKSK